MLQLRHVFLGRRFLRERPRQHELGLEHRIAALDAAIQSRRHPAQCRMTDSFLNIGNHLPRIGLIPAAIEFFGRKSKLHYQISRQILGLDFAPLLPPQSDQRLLVISHDDPRVRAANK
jgi:hypothetical protein